MVPTFPTAHTFCASCDGPRKSGFLTAVPTKTENDIFARFITVREKQTWQGLSKSKKKIRGNHAFFRDN